MVIFKQSRINRNIVECKEGWYIDKQVAPDSINRNIVDCKAEPTIKAAWEQMVLIET